METVVRRLTPAPVFTLAVVGTLTVGLGAFATVFTVVQKVLLDPLPTNGLTSCTRPGATIRPIFDLDRG